MNRLVHIHGVMRHTHAEHDRGQHDTQYTVRVAE